MENITKSSKSTSEKCSKINIFTFDKYLHLHPFFKGISSIKILSLSLSLQKRLLTISNFFWKTDWLQPTLCLKICSKLWSRKSKEVLMSVFLKLFRKNHNGGNGKHPPRSIWRVKPRLFYSSPLKYGLIYCTHSDLENINISQFTF